MGVALLVLGGDRSELILGLDDNAGEHDAGDLVAGGGGLHLLSSRVVDETLLGLAIASGEEDELGLVGVESLDVELELLLAGRGASVVDSDSHGAGEGGRETSSLQLDEGEPTAISDLAGVATRAGRDNRSELLDGSGELFAALSCSLLEPNQLLGGLIEVNSDSCLPVLAEMYVWDDVVVLDHC